MLEGVEDKLPRWARLALTIAAVATPVSAAAFTIVKTYDEVKAAKATAVESKVKVREQEKLQVGSYQTFGPAIEELQVLFNQSQDWSASTDAYIDDILDRLDRCEIYLTEIADRRGFPKFPELEDVGTLPWYDVSLTPLLVPGLPTSSGPRFKAEEKPKVKAIRRIPEDIEKAADYQQSRVEENCSPSDPLCGGKL